ncbi:VWA domain-containing protein [bacterium]|nr:VWA domain-containing protein [bacterium]
MRRLPVFFLIDVSESMVGEQIRSVNEGIKTIMSNLKSNPMALETVYIAIIVFAGKAKTVVPLTYILDFNPPELPIGGGTALGNAMNFLMDEINKQVQKTTSERKGDWKPIIFLLTDGSPTDQCAPAIKRWRSEFKNKASLVAIAMGDQVNTDALKEFTEQVFMFKDTDPKAYKEFFRWMSSSIEMKSKNIVADAGDKFQIQNLSKDIIQKDDKKERKPTHVDEKFIILLARCQNTKRPYLIKYEREHATSYNYKGSYPITEEYFDLSLEQQEVTVQSENLLGAPMCPYCKSPYGGVCVCGKLLCLRPDVPYNECPWCGRKGSYGGGAESFDVSRTQG